MQNDDFLNSKSNAILQIHVTGIPRAPVAQLVEHWAAMRKVVSSTAAGPTLRVLK